jgi:predicted metal-dependent phosphoesterase TrpH
LVDTKMNLTTLEAEHLSLQDELAIQRSKLETEIAEKSKILEILDEGMQGAGESALAAAQSSTTTTNKDQAKELRSVVTQWVSNTVSKKQTYDTSTINDTGKSEDDVDAGGNVSRQIMFDSLRGKGRHLLENIKLKGGDEIERIKQTGVKLPWQLKEEKEEEAKNALVSATTDEEQKQDGSL